MSRRLFDGPPRGRTLLLLVVLAVHCAALIWLGARWEHLRVMMYALHEVSSDAAAAAAPVLLAQQMPYLEDPLDELGRFTAVATPLVAGATSAPERARRIGDHLHSLRQYPDRGFLQDLRHGPDLLLDLMQYGWRASCGQATVVFATLWRSLGGHSKMVRWSDSAGKEGHYSVSLWDEQRQAWFYYDLNLNGYLRDADTGVPLSPSDVRARLLAPSSPAVTADATFPAYDINDLREIITRFPVESFVLNNNYMGWSPQQRFGPLNPYYETLVDLPRPWDRFLDNVTGHRDRRLVVDGRIKVGGLLPAFTGRLLLLYLMVVITACLVALLRRRSDLPAATHPAT